MSYPPSQAPPSQPPPASAAADLRPSRVRGTLVASSLAVFVAQVANALPGSLNGVLPGDFRDRRLAADLDHRSLHDSRGGI